MRKVTFLFCVLAITACTKERVKISGHLANAENDMLYLEEVYLYNTIPVDSVKLKKNGKFNFSFDTKIACFYQLRLAPDKTILLFPKPGEKIKVEADANNILTSLKTEGSHDTEQITKLMIMLNETKQQLDSISVLYGYAGSDTLKASLNKQYQNILERHRKISVAYILTNYNSLSSIYALYQQYQPGYYVFYKTTDLQYFRILSDSLSKYHPRSPHVASLKAYTEKLINDYRSKQLLQNAPKVTESLPEIKLPDIAGDSISLHQFKGKYVLLCFWSYGNQECVRQNLQMKKIYEKYRSKGLEIFQVSFDNSKEEWQKAVRYDALPWVSVIDTQYPNSIIAGNYNVQQLPANYLINKDNLTIMAKNLTPAQLRDKLEDIIK
jgi:peroxiredoxin